MTVMANSTVLTILLNYRTPEMTLRSLGAAMAAIEDLSGEIVVVDNASGDNSMDIIRQGAMDAGWLQSGRVRLIQSPVNGGFGAGMNVGIQAGLSDGSTPGFYYLLNSDAFANCDTIEILRDFLVNTPQAGLAGSFVHGVDDTPHCTAFRFPTIASEFEGAAHTGLITRLLPNVSVAMGLPDETTQVDWTAGASLMIRSEVIAAVGGFDETFFLYFEETELCRRAAAAGWQTFYVPRSRIAHVGSASTGMKKWARTPAYWFESRWYYFSKVHSPAYAWAATMARLAGGAIYSARRLVQNRPAMDPDGFAGDLWRHMWSCLMHRPKNETRALSAELKEPK